MAAFPNSNRPNRHTFIHILAIPTVLQQHFTVMNIITQTQPTQAFTHDIDDDERSFVSTAGIIPELTNAQRITIPLIPDTVATLRPVNSYYDIFKGPSTCKPQRSATSVKAHKRRHRTSKKSPASAMKENIPMEECDRKAIAALKTQQLFEIKARFDCNR